MQEDANRCPPFFCPCHGIGILPCACEAGRFWLCRFSEQTYPYSSSGGNPRSPRSPAAGVGEFPLQGASRGVQGIFTAVPACLLGGEWAACTAGVRDARYEGGACSNRGIFALRFRLGNVRYFLPEGLCEVPSYATPADSRVDKERAHLHGSFRRGNADAAFPGCGISP